MPTELLPFLSINLLHGILFLIASILILLGTNFQSLVHTYLVYLLGRSYLASSPLPCHATHACIPDNGVFLHLILKTSLAPMTLLREIGAFFVLLLPHVYTYPRHEELSLHLVDIPFALVVVPVRWLLSLQAFPRRLATYNTLALLVVTYEYLVPPLAIDLTTY